jgi:hypothetical protein
MRIKAAGLTKKSYLKNSKFTTAFGMLMALVLLRAEDIMDAGYYAIKQFLEENGWWKSLNRTNNSIESFHAAVMRFIKTAHPKMCGVPT